MSDHKWLQSEELSKLRHCADMGKAGVFVAHTLDDTDALNLLDDLAAAKAILRECAGVLAWIEDSDELQQCGEPETLANEASLMARIRAVPGVTHP